MFFYFNSQNIYFKILVPTSMKSVLPVLKGHGHLLLVQWAVVGKSKSAFGFKPGLYQFLIRFGKLYLFKAAHSDARVLKGSRFEFKNPPLGCQCFSTCQGKSLTKQWTYGPTKLPWNDHSNTSFACKKLFFFVK